MAALSDYTPLMTAPASVQIIERVKIFIVFQ